jgi:hypothetical protein
MVGPSARGHFIARRVPKGRCVFDYALDFKSADFQQCPGLYRVGKAEKGAAGQAVQR